MSHQIDLSNGNLSAIINGQNGQLVSIRLDGIDFFHNGGDSSWKGNGWKSSEIVPFPVFGPVRDYRVRVGDQEFSLDQHGISRNTDSIPFIYLASNERGVNLIQEYDGAEIPNSKFKPDSGRPEKIRWLPFRLEKSFFLLEKNSLLCELTVKNQSEVEMPYMIAWHPAFRMLGPVEKGFFCDVSGRELASLEQVIEASRGPKAALALEGINLVQYRNRESGLGVEVSSRNYPHIILWSPGKDAGMVCIEPTTQLPIIEGQNYFAEKEEFERLAPGSGRTYITEVKPLK
jgi:galactose mutarotase-like enzyme